MTECLTKAKITEKVHKPPRNHYIEGSVFSDIGLNCESQSEKGRTCKKYKILIGSRVLFFHFIHDLLFSPGHLLNSEGRFLNLFGDFSPLCGSTCNAGFENVSSKIDSSGNWILFLMVWFASNAVAMSWHCSLDTCCKAIVFFLSSAQPISGLLCSLLIKDPNSQY